MAQMVGRNEIQSTSSNCNNEELQLAEINRLPSFERLKSSIFDDDKAKCVVDVTKWGAQERYMFIEKLIKNIQNDNLHLLCKMRERIDKVGVELPSVEVRYNNLRVEAYCEVVHGKPLPTLWNSLKSLFSIDRLLAMLVAADAESERSGHPFPLTIVFVERKARCDDVAEALVAQGLHAVALHGGRSQSERESALREFRHGATNILVATDVASRGLDVTGVAHVINLDLPKTMEDYVHRIGRTGRAGSTGLATSVFTDRDTFLAAQIKKAIADVQAGNSVAFASGKIARRKEREAATADDELRISVSKISLMSSGTSINGEDKYRHMISPSMIKVEGSADSAWDD